MKQIKYYSSWSLCLRPQLGQQHSLHPWPRWTRGFFFSRREAMETTRTYSKECSGSSITSDSATS
ncbi:Hypothetical protein FKW44_014891 [Caligus rogercresseyi]|uniref:Uncharacterized protein n=1 Tax=Caligus rogercresseyi TaxID=217165 RepID=A0A7T8H061_CALRO|nr:Hypothetical protein FKW44_014891 [Caligus rogercresseyi]